MYFYFFKKESTISCLKKEAKLPNIFYFNQKSMKNLKKKKKGGIDTHSFCSLPRVLMQTW